jgi:hypothetical protein
VFIRYHAEDSQPGVDSFMALYHVVPSVVFLLAITGCRGWTETSEIEIVATDYAFQVPPKIKPGLVAFRFVNRGTVPHEVQFYHLRPHISRDSALRRLTTDLPDSLAVDGAGSVLWAPAGVTAHERLLVDVRAGDLYLLMCQFQNADSLPPHSKLGMITVFESE